MRNKKNGLILLLIFILLISGCSQGLNLAEAKEDYFTYYENDNIKIKISNKVKNKEETYNTILEDLEEIDEFSAIEDLKIDIDEKYSVPNIEEGIKCNSGFIKTEKFKKEIIKKSYDIYDNWISEGLYGKVFEEDVDSHFTAYYSNNEFSLFGARFFEPFSSKEEINNIQSASMDLVDYLIENGKKDELLKNEMKIEDIEKWAVEKEIDLSYQNTIESLMNRFEVYDLKFGSILTLNTREDINGFTIDISSEDEDYDSAKKIEEIILNMDQDISQIKDGIKADAPNFYEEYNDILDKVPKVKYQFDNSIRENGFSHLNHGVINLRILFAHAHEYGHILMAYPFSENGITINRPAWLDEGIASHLDFAYSDLTLESTLEGLRDLDNNLKELSKDESIQAEEIGENLVHVHKVNNLDFHNPEKIIKNKEDRMKVYLIHYSPFRETLDKTTIKEALNPGWNRPIDAGDHMNYMATFGFGSYLVGQYGLEEILYLSLEDFSNLTYEEAFGKGYEELKSDWIQYLKDNIKDIDLLFDLDNYK